MDGINSFKPCSHFLQCSKAKLLILPGIIIMMIIIIIKIMVNVTYYQYDKGNCMDMDCSLQCSVCWLPSNLIPHFDKL